VVSSSAGDGGPAAASSSACAAGLLAPLYTPLSHLLRHGTAASTTADGGLGAPPLAAAE